MDIQKHQEVDNVIPIANPLIGKEEKNAVIKVLSSGNLVNGEKVLDFEKKFSKYIGTKYAVAVNSGTAALCLSLQALGIKKGDEVITTPFSFISSSNCILYVGAKPIFVDIDPKTFNINPDLIEEKITKKTKAILPVHLYGQPCDMGKITKIAKENNLLIVEDACQAHGAEFKNKKVGSFGNTACFSFYATKNMTTGEGGMITTDSKQVAEICKILRDVGQEKKYFHTDIGFNFRMTDFQAVIGIEQLKKLDKRNELRRKNAKILTEKLEKIDGIITPFVDSRVKHVFHQYTIKTKRISNDKLSKKLAKNGIESRIYYPIAIHKQEPYKKLGYRDRLPEAEQVVKEVLSIPVHPSVSKKDMGFIAEKIKEVHLKLTDNY